MRSKKIKSTKMMNHHYARTTIDNLDDYMLTEILCRLPSCETVTVCKVVNKRWCSLISNPKFPGHFSNHKMKSSTFLASDPDSVDDDMPPWTFIATCYTQCDKPPIIVRCEVGNAGINGGVFGSPKFSLGFLPCGFNIEATFKDLVLCSNKVTHQGGGRVYYICNPLTKKWVALPLCPGNDEQLRLKPWASLICQESYDCTQDYKFRVVVVHRSHPPNIIHTETYKLVVYCSEIGEWKGIKLRISIKPKPEHVTRGIPFFQGVVINNNIYIYHSFCVAALDPFEVNETCDTTLEARLLPSPPIDGFFQESMGKLFIMHDPTTKLLGYKSDGNAVELTLIVWMLDPNHVHLNWKLTFQGSCEGNMNAELPRAVQGGGASRVLNRREVEEPIYIFLENLGMHLYNDKLIYVHLMLEQQLAVCDMRSGNIKPLKRVPGYDMRTFHRLELQWWPTSIPTPILCAPPHNQG